MDLHDLLSRKQTGASVSTSKVDNFEQAKSRLKGNLERQLKYWENREDIYARNASVAAQNALIEDKKDKKTTSPTTRSLWFKQKEMNDSWMFKMQIGTTPVYTSVAAKENNQPWIQNIDESEMANAIKMFIKGIEDKDEIFDKHLKETYNLYELNQKTSLLKSKATRDAKKAESES